jgi:hypothetical protein
LLSPHGRLHLKQTVRLLEQTIEQVGTGNAPRRVAIYKFQKGQSGNPAGRPSRPEARKIFVDVKAAARELTQEAIDTLSAIMKNPKTPAAARVSAASAVLDRGHGRPAQAVAVSVLDWDLDRLNDAQLAQFREILIALGAGMELATLPPPLEE